MPILLLLHIGEMMQRGSSATGGNMTTSRLFFVMFSTGCQSHSASSTIVIVISKLLKRYSKAKRTRAPAYSRALRRIKGGFPMGGQEKLRSEFQSTGRGQISC